jgi:hypothetical protein
MRGLLAFQWFLTLMMGVVLFLIYKAHIALRNENRVTIAMAHELRQRMDAIQNKTNVAVVYVGNLEITNWEATTFGSYWFFEGSSWLDPIGDGRMIRMGREEDHKPSRK